MNTWQEYFDHPEGGTLGILNSIYQIGSIASFPFGYAALSFCSPLDICGRRLNDSSYLFCEPE